MRSALDKSTVRAAHRPILHRANGLPVHEPAGRVANGDPFRMTAPMSQPIGCCRGAPLSEGGKTRSMRTAHAADLAGGSGVGDAEWERQWRTWVRRVCRSEHPEERLAGRVDAGAELVVHYFQDVNDVVRGVTKRPFRAHAPERREELIDRLCSESFALAETPPDCLRAAVRRITFATVLKWDEP